MLYLKLTLINFKDIYTFLIINYKNTTCVNIKY